MKGIIWMILPHHCLSLKEFGTRSQGGQEPGGRRWGRGHGGMFLDGLLLVICSTCFLIVPGITSPVLHLARMSCSLPHQSVIRNMPYSFAYGPILRIYYFFFNWGSLLSDILWQVDTELTITMRMHNGRGKQVVVMINLQITSSMQAWSTVSEGKVRLSYGSGNRLWIYRANPSDTFFSSNDIPPP